MLLLNPLSKIYLFIINLINYRFDKFPPKPLDFPVISIGGIRAGGSGKTPFADLIIGKVSEMGKTPVLFSRGYKRISKQTEIVPPDCETNWQAVGDEPLMLKKHHKNLWLAIDPNRRRAERKLRSFGLKNIVGIMDDGFQHRKFPRDLDIVILTETDLTDKVLPSGRLREPIKSLERADIIVSAQKTDSPKNCVIEFVAEEFANAVSGEKKTEFDGDILCFCGIARPQRFIDSVKKLTGKDCKTMIFSDHHKYNNADYNALNSASQAVFITTEKDFMRIDTEKSEFLQKLWYIPYRIRVNPEDNNFLSNKISELFRS